MSRQEPPRIVCVDDESRVVEGLVLHLRKDYQVFTALSGEEALKLLKQIGGAAVVVSDMRMPGMDGATLLHFVLQFFPDATRILLTGEPGRDAAVSAVNKAQIFRFLTKPVAFGRANRVKRLAMEFAAKLDCKEFWQLEAAAMLSQIGYLSLPPDLVEKLYYGETLTTDEKTLASAVPDVISSLLDNIPRLEPVIQILTALHWTDEQIARLGDGTIGLGTRILGLVLDYDTLVTQGQAVDVAMQTLKGRAATLWREPPGTIRRPCRRQVESQGDSRDAVARRPTRNDHHAGCPHTHGNSPGSPRIRSD